MKYNLCLSAGTQLEHLQVEYHKKWNTLLLTRLLLATDRCFYESFLSFCLFCGFYRLYGKRSTCPFALEVQQVNRSRRSNLDNWSPCMCRFIIGCLRGDSDIARIHRVLYRPVYAAPSRSSRSHKQKYRSLMNYGSPAVKMDRGKIRICHMLGDQQRSWTATVQICFIYLC